VGLVAGPAPAATAATPPCPPLEALVSDGVSGPAPGNGEVIRLVPGAPQSTLTTSSTPPGPPTLDSPDDMAFDLNGNPVRYFDVRPPGSQQEFSRKLVSEGRPLDMAVDGSDQIYVLYVTGDGRDVEDYRVDVYTKRGEVLNKATRGANVARLAVDYWRSIFGANYAPLTELGTTEKRIDPRLGVAEPSLSRFDPTG